MVERRLLFQRAQNEWKADSAVVRYRKNIKRIILLKKIIINRCVTATKKQVLMRDEFYRIRKKTQNK